MAALLPLPVAAMLPSAHPPTAMAAAWFGADSYPAEAMRRNEQGRVVAILRVDAAGRITSCVVTGSSGSAALDRATCRAATDDRRVGPATDERGRPVEATMPLSVRWVLPVKATPSGQPASASPADVPHRARRSHRSWLSRLVEAHHLLPTLVLVWAALSRRVRKALGWGVFDEGGTEVWGDRLPPRRRRPRLDRVMRATAVAAPVLALAALLAWFDP